MRDIGKDNAIFTCAECKVPTLHVVSKRHLAHMEFATVEDENGGEHATQVQLQHLIYKCVKCEKHTYFLMHSGKKVYKGAGMALVAELPAEIIHRYPVSIPSIHQSVPASVTKAAIEAEKCLSVAAPNACGVMARRAMHALCEDKKAEGKNLYDQLEFLKDNHVITPDLWVWAEELRILGRSGAHPEWEEVSLDEAEYAMRFLREIIRYVYINPWERGTRKVKETKKKRKSN